MRIIHRLNQPFPYNKVQINDHVVGSSFGPLVEPKIARAQYELMQSLQDELIQMRKTQEDLFFAMMRK
jgi:hypothetical protein